MFIGINIFNLTFFQLSYGIIILLLSFWPPLFTALYESLLRTEISAAAKIVFSVVKILIGISLLYLGFGLIGILWGFIIASIVLDFILLFFGFKIFNEYKLKLAYRVQLIPDLIRAGVPFWLPTMLGTLSTSIGILSIYGLIGSIETGLYHIAFLSLLLYTQFQRLSKA